MVAKKPDEEARVEPKTEPVDELPISFSRYVSLKAPKASDKPEDLPRSQQLLLQLREKQNEITALQLKE